MSNRLAALYNSLDGDLIEETGFDTSFYRSCSSLLPDFTHAQAAAYSLSISLGKKFLPEDTEIQDAKALAKFEACNLLASKWVYKPITSRDEQVWGTFKDVLYRFFTPQGLPLICELDTAFLHGKCGPGSSVGGRGGDFYSKMFSSRLTCSTPVLKFHYLRNLHRFPEWIVAEDFRSASFGEPLEVQGSRLSFVPKTTAISRSICVEPTLNMFYQLGLADILERRLRSFFKIDLSKQPELNRDLARQGSISGDLATIDLESASDSISLEMCRASLPKEAFDIMKVLRSPSCSYRDKTYTFNMISTMGNGFTFPLQTIIFASAVSAVYKAWCFEHSHGDATFGPNAPCGVFGDDIIVHSDMYDRVVRFLAQLGFSVNNSKSFSRGPFRESCGCDFFSGRNIRGVYCQRLNTPQDSYALINAINWFSARTGLKLERTVGQLKRWCNSNIVVPPAEDPSSGIQVPLCLLKTRTLGKQTQGIAYICYVSEPKVIRIGDSYINTPRGVKSRIYNPSGLLLAFLSGMALSSGLPLRNNKVKWRTKRRFCSSWNNLPPDSVANHGVDRQRWETAVSDNLLGY